ncbi:MAG TPA: protein kinase [Bryobacteraceae bacterium]|nr:protein kinase [Bryobacteraceae bacterium]
MNLEDRRSAQKLCQAALRKAPEARQAFLDEVCAGDSALRRQVERLLASNSPSGNDTSETATARLLGRQLGPYRIVAPLGAGGMGEVYRAHDSKLGREVAVKTLPAYFARDPDRLGRLRREARALAALNHPNIAAIYGLEESEEVDCLVLELVEGESLRGPLPIPVALDRARQVAEALEAAHARGIIHRDLKPSNIKVTPEGRVKVLDFGLAKAIAATERNLDSSQAATVTGAQTVMGRVVGTPGYMSPEQARGLEVDERSDIWAFGCVFYELLAGTRVFRGDSNQETLAAVLEREPDWQALPIKTPARVRALLRDCLRKDPTRRPISIAEVRKRIEQEQSGRNRWRVAAIAAMVLAAAAVAAVSVVLFRSQTPRGPARLEYTQLTNFADPVVSPALSPDGRLLTFIRGGSTFVGPGEIYVQLLPNGEPAQLTRDRKQKMSPVFSPDGSRIAYTTVNESTDWDTWSVPALGGPPGELLHNASGLTWTHSRDGQSRVLFSEMTGEGIHMALTAATENRLDARRVYAPPNLNGMAHRSSVSPDGRWVLVVEMGGGWLPCRLVPYDGSSLGRAVGPRSAPCTYAAWSPNGGWMYFSANAGNGFHVWRQRFPDGEPEQVTAGATEEQGLAFAPDGRSFVTSIGVDQNTIWVHDAHGERQVTFQGYAYLPKFSPDGKRLYYMLRSGVSTRTWVSGELRVADLESGEQQRLLSDFRMQDYSLSPDGRRVAFTAIDDTGRLPVWIAALDGSSPPRRLADVESGRALFGPDGDVFFVQDGFLQRIKADGGGRKKLIQDRVGFLYGLSADGKWAGVWKGTSVAIYSLDSGSAIELCSFCGTVGAENRGITPSVVSWSRDGRFLYVHFAWTTRETYAVPLRSGQTLPPLPKGGIHSAEEAAALPGAQRIPQLRAFVGDDPSVYAFMRNTSQRNIYRVPVP